ncbi:uncharacterized protein EDB91DRAFT_81834 [Suillus paluster]|uniref:uncharacterized protein n=1 Tax=Suillus paluster TaxID=48578 RepID=UPI001B85D1EF|nr:uncharacterized protein EDB91DRAFT_81834 [Suillus paluster]KAG1725795.1 hypothetical protein EDB91DRAFT_81834 [Suillus paluster]
MKSFAILSLFIVASVAQSSSNPYIPSGISQGCSNYLVSLNSNVTFSSCTTPIISATSQFAPGVSSSSINTTTINTALSNLCSTSAFNACPDSTVRAQLMAYYSACSVELTTSLNIDVLRTYDVLYTLTPLRQAVCSKADNGQYCVTQLNITSSSSATGNVAVVTSPKQDVLQQYLYTTPDLASGVSSRRDVSNTTTALIPNTTTYQDTNLVFLFLQPSMTSTQLCTTCTRNTLTPYITFESSLPYAPGLSNSLLLRGQTALYNAILANCTSGFLSGAVQAAGGLSGGILSSSAPRSISADLSLLVSAMLGAAGLAITAF